MTGLHWTPVVIGGLLCGVTILVSLIWIPILIRQLLHGRHVIQAVADAKQHGLGDEFTLAAAISCTWCRPGGDLPCRCERKCGHIRCAASDTIVTGGWTAAEMAALRGEKELPL